MSTNLSQLPSVLIVGGGIGGLVLAVSLRKAGHQVHVIEQKREYTLVNSGGGLNLTKNATRFIFGLGLKDEFEAVADAKSIMTIMRASDGTKMENLSVGQRHFARRYDLLQVLVRSAKELGATISMGCSVQSFKEEHDLVVADLSTGDQVSANFLIGADGVHSKVRRHMFASQRIEPRLTGQCTFLVDLPKSMMEAAESTKELYHDGQPWHFIMGDDFVVISWTMSHRDVYHMQINDLSYGTGSRYGVNDAEQRQFVSSVEDLGALRQRLGDIGGAFGDILSRATKATKWLISKLPDLPSWSSNGGRIILLGDAAHAFAPFAGQGSCMAIEDAAVLADLLAEAGSDKWSPKALASLFEQVRKPRVSRMKTIVDANAARWMRDEEEVVHDELAVRAANEEWIENYDAVQEARHYVLERNNLRAD